jgi:hypothetical protein
MNERIKELVKQAEQYALDKANESEEEDFEISFDDDFQEKFAELIVGECISKLDDIGVIDRDSRTIAMKVISEHFGVEE